MKRPLVIITAVVILGVGVFLLVRPGSDPGSTPGSEAPDLQPGAGASIRAPGPSAPDGTPDPPASDPSNPAAAAREDPGTLAPEPLPLNFSRPPFEKQKNGTIYKMDVIRRAQNLHDADEEPLADLEIVDSLVASYREIFRENPVAGENWEAVAALTGKNHYKLVLIDPAHPAINQDRELVDRWGTPFRFHAISRSFMEISSAGEDRKWGTGDDLMLDEPVPIGDRGPGSEANPKGDESEEE